MNKTRLPPARCMQDRPTPHIQVKNRPFWSSALGISHGAPHTCYFPPLLPPLALNHMAWRWQAGPLLPLVCLSTSLFKPFSLLNNHPAKPEKPDCAMRHVHTCSRLQKLKQLLALWPRDVVHGAQDRHRLIRCQGLLRGSARGAGQAFECPGSPHKSRQRPCRWQRGRRTRQHSLQPARTGGCIGRRPGARR